jgi:hypothetical protein
LQPLVIGYFKADPFTVGYWFFWHKLYHLSVFIKAPS